MRIRKNKLICKVLELITTLWKVYIFLVMTSKWCKIPTGKCMASDRGQNRYSDFVALETPLRFENCSSSHCLLSSWRRFHVFELSHPSFHRTVFFGAPLAFPRGVAMGLCRCCIIFMSSCRRVFLSSTALHTWAGTLCMGTYIVPTLLA